MLEIGRFISLRTCIRYAWSLPLLIASPSWSADVYRSQTVNGEVVFASHPNDDENFTLFLSEEKPKSNADKSMKTRPRQKAPSDLVAMIRAIAGKHEVDPDLVLSIVEIESNFNTHAISPRGARGLMQLMPLISRHYGAIDASDPEKNVEAGVRYLKDLLALHNNNIALALASYNAGETAVSKHKLRIPPYKETMLYVPAVMNKLHAHRASNNP